MAYCPAYSQNIPSRKTNLRLFSIIVLAGPSIPNYYVFISVRTVVGMVSTGMLEKKEIHQEKVADDVQRFLDAGGSIEQCSDRTSQQAECDYHFTGQKKRKYSAKIKRDFKHGASKKRMTFKAL